MAVCDMKVMDTLNLFYSLSMRFQLAVVNHVYLQMTSPSSLSYLCKTYCVARLKQRQLLKSRKQKASEITRLEFELLIKVTCKIGHINHMELMTTWNDSLSE
ncbi:hypothetical protein QQG55_24920 [Brugia pahangi]